MAEKRKKGPNLDAEFWRRFDDTTRRLLERIAYYERKAAEAKAARGEADAA